MKAITSIILSILIILLGWYLINLFVVPIKFNEQKDIREAQVVESLKDIRTIQRMYREKFGKFAHSFAELENFYNNESIEVVQQIGSEDDLEAIAAGKISRKVFTVAVKDTLFKNYGAKFDIKKLKLVPFSDKATGDFIEFTLKANDSLLTQAELIVPVFEASVKYNDFLGDLDEQELINYRDLRVNTLKRFDGLKVGSITAANNEAGNWE